MSNASAPKTSTGMVWGVLSVLLPVFVFSCLALRHCTRTVNADTVTRSTVAVEVLAITGLVLSGLVGPRCNHGSDCSGFVLYVEKFVPAE